MREKHYTASELIRAAGRDGNKKRPYLLVNPLQGKHVPVQPKEARYLFTALADAVAKELQEKKTVLVIAFAETATAIGAGVAAALPQRTFFLHTTREEVEGAEYLYFSESHSHATEQRLVVTDLKPILTQVDQILFVEDEVTTGNTIRKLIGQLQQVEDLPLERFGIASLLNGMTKEIRTSFQKDGIHLTYLVASDNLAYAKKLEQYRFDGVRSLPPRKLDVWEQIRQISQEFVQPQNTRRVVETVSYQAQTEEFAQRISEAFRPEQTQERVLVLGTEEYMYVPLCVAEILSQREDIREVRFHATTRSPILPSTEPEYPLHRRQQLCSVYDPERVTYLYNLQAYDHALIVTDAKMEGNLGLEQLAAALYMSGTTSITIVSADGQIQQRETRPEPKCMRCAYREEDVTLLLKDITGRVKPQSTEERERLIQGGRHYCEMLPIEYSPSMIYMEAYKNALQHYASVTAHAIGVLADRILEQKGKDVVLVSLARAGIPIGILVRHYIEKKYHYSVPHYAISIIRDRGIDHNAMKHLLHHYEPQQIQFLDGWIGKGAILRELRSALAAYPEVSTELAVVADPANVTDLCGTHEDILIPSSCLNSTVSGLVSRTFLRSDIIGPQDFHGAVYYENLKEEDLSEAFLQTIEQHFTFDTTGDAPGKNAEGTGLEEVYRIMKDFSVDNVNFVKPGIGEATRVLLRRVPWRILIRKEDYENPMLTHLLRLAQEKNVEVVTYPLQHYRACGIIKKMADI